MARVLFTSFGSYGDLYPYLAVGRALVQRGYTVTIGTSASFEGKVREAGVEFAAIRPDVSLGDNEMLAYVFDRRRGTERVMRMLSSVVRETYEDTVHAARSCDAIVTHPITFAAVLAARKLRLPWISSVLAPISVLSAIDPPVLAPAPFLRHLRALGPAPLRLLHAFGRRSALPWVRPVLDLARELGLDTGANPVFEGSHSGGLVLALFSRLLGVPQADWPANVVVTGFPFYDGAPGERLDPGLDEYLNSGPPPVVFTLGSSAVGAAGAFYRESLACVERLGLRAVFLTGAHSHGLPAAMPSGTIASAYAAHGLLFPRAAAVVHQGGVGTTAQALRAGRPMLVVPFAHDQFDNAHRIRRLGAGALVYRSRYTSARATQALEPLLLDDGYREAAGRAARVVDEEDGATQAAAAIDRFLRSS